MALGETENWFHLVVDKIRDSRIHENSVFNLLESVVLFFSTPNGAYRILTTSFVCFPMRTIQLL